MVGMLVQLVGVRQHILMRGHVDGYRLLRLTNAQLLGFPFTSMEQWKLRMIRKAHVIFKSLTRGTGASGACSITTIVRKLRQEFRCARSFPTSIPSHICKSVVKSRSSLGTLFYHKAVHAS